MTEKETIAALQAGEKIGALKAAGTVHEAEAGAVPFLVVRDGDRVQPIEDHLSVPRTLRQSVKLTTAASFLAYLHRFKDTSTVVFSDVVARQFTAVLDYHTPGPKGASWCRHRATFKCEPTPEWSTWAGKTGQAMPQVDFAQFIENGIGQIAEPAGADLLSMVLTLEQKKAVAFRSSVRLADGQTQFKYEEQIDGATGAQVGTFALPPAMVLALSPFYGTDLRRVDARLRYRINSGELKLWYELVDLERVLREAFAAVVAQIVEGVPDVPVLDGAPVVSPNS